MDHTVALAHNRELPELASLRDYYEGQRPLSYMHPETLDDRGARWS